MLRRAFTFASMISLLLLGVIVAISIRTHFTTDCLIRASGGHCIWIDTLGTDSLWVFEFDGWPVDEPLHRWHGKEETVGYRLISDQSSGRCLLELGPDGRPVQRSKLAEWHRFAWMTGRTLYWLRFSNWIAMSFPLPLIWAALRVRLWLRPRRRITGGSCGNCGYDLRASPNRYPECGTVPTH